MNVSGISGLGSLNVSANYASTTIVTSAQQTGPLAALNLTQTQENQIDKILQNAISQNLSPSQVQSQINSVLTPAQQQQLQNESGHHRHHHHGGSGASQLGSDDGTDAFGIPTSISAGSSAGTQAIGDVAASFWAQNQQQQQGNS